MKQSAIRVPRKGRVDVALFIESRSHGWEVRVEIAGLGAREIAKEQDEAVVVAVGRCIRHLEGRGWNIPRVVANARALREEPE